MAHFLHHSISIYLWDLGIYPPDRPPSRRHMWYVPPNSVQASSEAKEEVHTYQCFNLVVWYGIQSFTGGLLVSTILSTIFTSYQHMHNTLPASASMTTKQFVGFVIYNISKY